MKIIGEAPRDKSNGSRCVNYQCDCGYVGTTRASRFKLIKSCSACSRKTARLLTNNFVVIGDFAHIDISTDKFPNTTCVIDVKNIPLVIDGRGRWFASNFGSKVIYAVRGQRCEKMHRLILGEGVQVVDHRDGNGLNNTEKNLVSCTQAENMKNRSMCRKNTSGVIGVGKCKLTGLWVAQAGCDGKKYKLGKFKSLDEAAKARKQFELEHGFSDCHGRALP